MTIKFLWEEFSDKLNLNIIEEGDDIFDIVVNHDELDIFFRK